MNSSTPLRVMVWDENPPHAPKKVYPNSINGAIVEALNELGEGSILAFPSNLDGPEQGCSEQALQETDVLIWWGHARHREVTDDTMMRIYDHVHQRGMGFIALHSAHYSKPFQAVLACPGHLKGGWREADPPDTEEIRVCAPKHPIAQGVDDFVLPQEEMYGAPFDVPPPLCVVFQSYFPLGGEYFPSGLCWTVGVGKKEGFTSGRGGGENEGEGAGRVFYFRPGHETFPTYFHPIVRRIIYNAVLWCGRRV
ncbi:MAG TPA: ThuA domain-containing protein [Chthonomonas sp.]|uniref:ThuA domain-containing protein n=1 Tax=Chthonomonas sp. TaxID=2282153 RepID=UPI002B4B815B|nr:ThuA domain-containing protein [Chthonomonas sp.]HLI47777.1 ThuA domain-containing protein [Chthonomonas sp.]